MDIAFVRSWQALALRGATGIAFGGMAFLWPDLTFAALTLIFGSYALLDGALAIFAARRCRPKPYGWLFALEGCLGLAAGVVVLVATGRGSVGVAYVIGPWAIASGVIEIATSVRLRREIPGEFLLDLSGAVSIALGILVFVAPRSGALVWVLLLGGYALSFGTIMLALALRMRRIADKTQFSGGQPPTHRAA